jgi:hypothetical protein
MPPAKVMRVLWRVAIVLLMLLWEADGAVRFFRDPYALRFFGFWIVVAAAVGAVGTVVALLIVAFRRIAADSPSETGHRLL